jgi:hypothetical protein
VKTVNPIDAPLRRKLHLRKMPALVMAAAIIAVLTLLASGCSLFTPPSPESRSDHYESLLLYQDNGGLTELDVEWQLEGEVHTFNYDISIGGRELYIPVHQRMEVIGHIYNKSDDAIVGEFLYARNESKPRPRGLFLVGDYLYYNYGNDRVVKTESMQGQISTSVRKFRFAKINLLTMVNENISKDEYEEEYEKAKMFLEEKYGSDFD